MGTGGKPRENAIRCQCGYCGKDSTSGIWFVPTRTGQKYFNEKHFLMKQYNGKIPYKKTCECGCGRKFYTIDKYKNYIKGHQNKFRCDLCREEIDKNSRLILTSNKQTFNLCERCFEQVQLHKSNR